MTRRITSVLSLIVAFTVVPLFAQTTNGPAPSAEAKKTERRPDVIFVPTPQHIVDKMLEMAEVKPGEVLYDLGCGDGRIVVSAAKKGLKATGYDIDPQRVSESKENVRTNNVENLASIEQADIFTLDLSKADVITLYLLPRLNVQLIPQLEKLKPGARIVSHAFDMEGIKPVDVYRKDGYVVYKWVTPLQKESSPTGQETGVLIKHTTNGSQ